MSISKKNIVSIAIAVQIVMLVGYWHKSRVQNGGSCGYSTCAIDPNQSRGKIIILNGPSASGKTTTQKALQLIMPDFYVRIGIDNFFEATLPEVTGPSMVNVPLQDVDREQLFPQGISKQEWERVTSVFQQSSSNGQFIRAGVNTFDEQHNPLLVLRVGKLGERVIHGMHRAIAAYADAGNNIIVDYILYEQEWLADLVCVLQGYDVYFVGVEIPLSVLEEREKARGTSPVGHARSHYDQVHKPGIYDFVLDTSKMTPEEAAHAIKQFVENTPQPSAFKTLQKQLLKDR